MRDDDHQIDLAAYATPEPQVSRTEDYWRQRNALVDAVLAAQKKLYPDGGGWEPVTEYQPEYDAAMDALKAFDAAHGGAPVI